MNIRVRFSKHGCLKFIGHLDVMRYFQKAMRRAEIDMCYSEGFSPHMIMSFASPLGLGLESDGEYMDISVKQSPSSKEAVERLNAVMAEGIEVLSWRELPENSKNAWQVWPGLIMKSISGKAMNWKKAGKRSWKSFLLCQRSVS